MSKLVYYRHLQYTLALRCYKNHAIVLYNFLDIYGEIKMYIKCKVAPVSSAHPIYLCNPQPIVPEHLRHTDGVVSHTYVWTCLLSVNPSQPIQVQDAADTSRDSGMSKMVKTGQDKPTADCYADFLLAYATIPGSCNVNSW